jgi:hypothetical protein
MLGLSYFTMLCNDAEYKNMDQDESLGQLYDEQMWMKIFYKQTRLGLLIFYNSLKTLNCIFFCRNGSGKSSLQSWAAAFTFQRSSTI